MKKLILLLLASFCFHTSFSQDEPDVIKVRKKAVVEEIFTLSEPNPSYPGGDSALFAFLAQQIVYPDSLKAKGVQGKVYCQFVVEKNGELTEIKIIRSPHPGFNPTVLQAMRNMPKWNPGMQLGKPVRVRFVIPIQFHVR